MNGDHDFNIRNPSREKFNPLSGIGQVTFNDIWILHRTVDKMPWADPGTTEQEVGEHLPILVPVQSCLTALKWKTQDSSNGASQVYSVFESSEDNAA